MIPYEKALNIVLENIKILKSKTIEITLANNLVLRENIYSDIDNPLFDNSEMDGYAVKSSDTENASYSNPVKMLVKEKIPAGKVSTYKLKKGEAACIMTGAPIPKGADTVIKVEDIKKYSENEIEIYKKMEKGNHIRYKGEDFKKGELIVEDGIRITSPIIALLAAVGKKYVKVSKSPTVGIIATGDELVEPEIKPAAGKIRNSSSYYLYSQVLEEGGLPYYYGIIQDDYSELKRNILEALNNSDMVITTGGVSVGKYDYVPEIFQDIGIDIKFKKVAIKPGKPTVFGMKDSKIVFGLPGNPVSTMISFNKFVSPCMAKMMGIKDYRRKIIPCISDNNIKLEKGRKNYVRVTLELKGDRLYAKSISSQGSALLKSIIKAEGVILISKEKSEIKKGESVLVELF